MAYARKGPQAHRGYPNNRQPARILPTYTPARHDWLRELSRAPTVRHGSGRHAWACIQLGWTRFLDGTSRRDRREVLTEEGRAILAGWDANAPGSTVGMGLPVVLVAPAPGLDLVPECCNGVPPGAVCDGEHPPRYGIGDVYLEPPGDPGNPIASLGLQAKRTP